VAEWADVTLGDVLTLQRGFDITKKQVGDGSVPVVSSSGVAYFHNVAKASGPGVVIGRKGSLGTVYFLDEPFWPHDTTLWVKDFKGNDPYFCFLLLKMLRLDELDVGAANPTLNRNHAHQLAARLPDLMTQRRISSTVNAFSSLIEINKRRIEVLEDLAQSLYREWFQRFHFPGHGDIPMVESAEGSVPKGWKSLAIGDLAVAVRGRSYRKGDIESSGGVPFLNLKCVKRGGGFRRTGLKRYSGSYKEAQLVIAGDILMAVTDMTQERRVVAQAFRMPSLDEPFAIPSLDLVLLKLESGDIRSFLYATLRYSTASSQLREMANGANVLHLPVERILEYRILVPDRAVRRAFQDAMDPILSESELLERQIEKLDASCDLLLPRLVSGELDIADVDLGVLTPTEAE
jgi:type I restriction enzyme, S subunit